MAPLVGFRVRGGNHSRAMAIDHPLPAVMGLSEGTACLAVVPLEIPKRKTQIASYPGGNRGES